MRAQTSIDRHTGTALENTYRLTRNLKADGVFRAPVRFVEPPDESVLTALVLGAAALQHMGTSRTRGLGKVNCRFICGLTDQILNSTTLPSITIDNPVDLSQTPKENETESANVTEEKDTAEQLSKTSEDPAADNQCSNCATPTHILRYRLTFMEQVVIPMADGDPNTVVTRQEVPGSNVLGAAAWNYLRHTDKSPEEDETFRQVFLDGGLRFLTAYPEAIETRQRMIPIPHSIREFKRSEAQIVDFLKQPPAELVNQPTKRLNRRYGRIGRKGLETQTVKTGRNYHHSRPQNDRTKGRALGSEVDGGGTIFQYEAIQAGQTFQGVLLGSQSELADLKKWLPDKSLIRVGRSRSAQYGETKFEWIDETPKEFSDILAEWNAFIDREDYDPEDVPLVLTEDRLIITTLSPLLAVNENGHPDAHFPIHELAKVLGIKVCELKLSGSYTRTEMMSGYHSHLRLPRQQWHGIAAGSVFVFCIKTTLDEKRLLKLERNGLGLRKNEGYGRIAVNRQDDITLTKEIQLDDPEKPKRLDAPDEQIIPDEVQELLESVVLRRCLVEMQAFAMKAANLIVKRIPADRLPSNNLIGQFRIFLKRDDFGKNSNEFINLAKEKFTNDQIDISEIEIPELKNLLTLSELFKAVWDKRESITRQLAEDHMKDIFGSDYDETRSAIITKLESKNSEEMCVTFYNHLLTGLRREPQLQKTETQQGTIS